MHSSCRYRHSQITMHCLALRIGAEPTTLQVHRPWTPSEALHSGASSKQIQVYDSDTVKGSHHAADGKTAWQLSVEGNLHMFGAQSSLDIVQARFTFLAGKAVYNVRFPSTAAAVHFGQVYARRLWQHV